MKKTGLIAMALIIGLLLGAAIPVMALSRIDAKQKRQIRTLKARVTVIENAPDTTTGLADEINNLKDRANWAASDIGTLYEKASHLNRDGVYDWVIRRGQIRLSDGDGCSNGQPRAALWDSGNLAC